jgi:7-cyano-7-deazaguanine reductase
MAISVLEDFNQLHLGRATGYVCHYDSSLLQAISRQIKRDELAIAPHALPFYGEDVWNGYEVSWLNPKGKPQVALMICRIPADSPNLVESKSFKLYLNSFNQTEFVSFEQVAERIRQDIGEVVGAPVTIELMRVDDVQFEPKVLQGDLLDELDIEVNHQGLNPALLKADEAHPVQQTWVSHLLKSNCLVTSQPDWASVQIAYEGPCIEPESLLQYLISFRLHDEFHEQCVERIFTDIMAACRPAKLSVYARYTRRGGLDINPYRTTEKNFLAPNLRTLRQ